MMSNSNGCTTFHEFIAGLGFEPPKVIEPGRWTPFSTNGKHHDTAGRVRLFPDGEGGIVHDWRSGEQWTWQAKRDRELTPEESRARREKIERAKREGQAEREREAQQTAERAARIWREAKPADAHPYLTAKGVQSHGLRIYRGPLALNAMKCDGALILPARNVAGDLVSLSFIAPSGEKRYLAGPRPPGCYFSIGKPEGVLCIVEGYATGASIHGVTGHAVAVAFDAGNLDPTARALRGKFPELRLILCADDDAGTEGNPGVSKATAAAHAVGGLVVVPDFGPNRPEGATDFNDLAKHRGAEAVRTCIERATAPQVPQDQLPAPSAPTADVTGPRAIVRRFSEIESKPMRWLWPGRIARGKVSMIAGNPGLGKSQITASMAAIVTRGGFWPVDRTPCERGSIIFLSAEDDAEDTIRPRLEAAGADLSRCSILDAVVEGFTSNGTEIRRSFNLGRDLDRLAEVLDRMPDAAVVVIDPISAYLGDANSHNNAEVRALLAPLSDLAGRRGVAIVAVSHLNKGGSSEALMRVTGSLAFVAAARAAYIVAADKDDPARRLFLPLKNNIGRDLGGLAFGIESITVPCGAESIESSRVSWEAHAVTITADEAMAPALNDEDRTDLDDAVDFLSGLLADGPIASRQVYQDADAAGHSKATIRRAQRTLAIESTKEGMKGGWTWRLPPKMLKSPEDAHPKSVSTFAENEHLRAPARAPASADTDDDESALMALIERVAAHYRCGPEDLAAMKATARTNPAEAWRTYKATAETEGIARNGITLP